MDEELRKNVCKVGQGQECCRYLGMANGDWTCFKLDQGMKTFLDRRVAEEALKARGDNCPGIYVPRVKSPTFN
jgi:hypothetical protein